MAANTAPIFSDSPRVGAVTIPQTNAVPKSDGTSSGAGVEIMYCVLEPGADGSWVSKIIFNLTSATASQNSTATNLRIFLTTVAQTQGAASGATTNTDTWLVKEIAVPVLTADAPSTALNSYEVPLNFGIQSTQALLVCQHVAQANAVFWQAICVAGDY